MEANVLIFALISLAGSVVYVAVVAALAPPHRRRQGRTTHPPVEANQTRAFPPPVEPAQSGS
jgi:hypothetical protein